MQKRFFFTLLFAIISLASMAELTYLSTADFKRRVCFYDLSSGQQPEWKYLGDRPCLIDFSTTWCGWCTKLHPILEQVAEQYDGKLYVYTLDAEKEPEIAALWRAQLSYCRFLSYARYAHGVARFPSARLLARGNSQNFWYRTIVSRL